MKLPVQASPRRDVVVPPKFTHIFLQDRIRFRKIVFRQVRNRKFQNLRLEQSANRKKLFHVIGRQGWYNRAPVRNNGNQSLRIQLTKRFANWNPADLVLTRNSVLSELSALRNFSANNLVAQLIGNRRSERLSRDG